MMGLKLASELQLFGKRNKQLYGVEYQLSAQ